MIDLHGSKYAEVISHNKLGISKRYKDFLDACKQAEKTVDVEDTKIILTTDWEELLSTKLRDLEKTASMDEMSAPLDEKSKIIFDAVTCDKVFREFIHNRFPYHVEVWQSLDLWTVKSGEQRTVMHCPLTAGHVKKERAFLSKFSQLFSSDCRIFISVTISSISWL